MAHLGKFKIDEKVCVADIEKLTNYSDKYQRLVGLEINQCGCAVGVFMLGSDEKCNDRHNLFIEVREQCTYRAYFEHKYVTVRF